MHDEIPPKPIPLAFATQVDVLFLVAGYQHYDQLGKLETEGLRIHFEINSIGPLLTAQALTPNLKPCSKVFSFEFAC